MPTIPHGYRSWLVAAILLATIGCDQATKQLARTHLDASPRTRLNGALQFVLTENRGSFLSLGDRLPPVLRFGVFTAGVGAALLIGLVLLFRHRFGPLLDVAALALVIGGGLGNLLDRALREGAVTDFVILGVGPLHTGIFNVADVAITFGVLALVARSMFHSRDAAAGDEPLG